MNFAHFHLIINHIPMFTMPVALIFFMYSLKINSDQLKKFSVVVLLLTAATVLPVYFTGEPAEEVIEHLPGVSEQLIEAHEEAAETALVATILTGIVALVTLLTSRNLKFRNIVPKVLIFVCLVSTGLLGYVAFLGGKIRHPEATNEIVNQAQPAENTQ